MDKGIALRKLRKYQIPIYIIVVIAYMLIAFSRGAPAIMGPTLIEDLHLTAAQWGLVGLVFFWAYAIANAPSGAIADILGPRKCVLFCLILIALGCFAFGAAESLGMILAGRLLIGMGTAGLMMAGIKLISSWFTVRQFSLYYGGYLGLGGLGSVFATAPLQLMMDQFGWRGAFLIIGGGTVALIVIAFLMIRNQPQDIGLPSPDEIAGEEVPNKEPEVQLSWGAAARQLIKRPAFWIIGFFFIGTNGTGQVIASMWGGVLLADVYGFSKAEVSSVLTVAAFGLIIGSLVAGWLCRRIGSTGVMLSTGIIYLATWMYMLINLRTLSIPQLQVIYSVIGFVQMFAVVGGMSCVRELVPGSMVGTAIGGVNTFSWIFGAGLFNQLWGVIIGSVSGGGQRPYPIQAFETAMWMQAGVLLLTLICAVIVLNIMRRNSAVPTTA